MNWQKNDMKDISQHRPGEGLAWIQDLRQKHWQQFLEQGLPTRQNEAWKYTDIRKLSESFFSDEMDFEPQTETDSVKPCAPLLGEESLEFLFVNGQLKNIQGDVPPGLVVTDMRSALFTYPEWVQGALSVELDSVTALFSLNTSLWENGVFVWVSDGTIVEKPLVIRMISTHKKPQMRVLRHLVVLGKKSHLTLFHDFHSEDLAPRWEHALTQIQLAEQSQLDYIKSQREAASVTHLSDNIVHQSAASVLNAKSFSLGAKIHRESWEANLAGQRARCDCSGLAIATQDQHLDTYLRFEHQAPACESEQVYKSIATEKARTVFNGKVVVQATGQQAQAHQLSRNLLLSPQAEIDTRPELEIYTDDVKCTHGASVGELDPDALFYLQSRGIEQEEARAMLLQAFVQDQLATLPEAIQVVMAPFLEKKLAQISGENPQW